MARTRAALCARGYSPRHALHAGPLGRAAGTLFLRTYTRGERVHLAMLSRGWDGSMPQLTPLVLTRADIVFAGVLIAGLAGRPARVRSAVEAVGLRYEYPAGGAGLDGVDLHVREGERVAILGPNGAGKTTLMLHLNGLLRGRGELEVTGLAVADCDLRELRARVGLVFQDPDDQLFMPTVKEDVGFGPLNMGLSRDEVRLRVGEALSAVRMQGSAARAPHELSMGERRRVAVATVLAMHPLLLVLDEPSANLDPRARRELMDVLERIERTLIVTTHDLPLAAELCERAVILFAGRVVADGPCREVLRDAGLLAAYDLELPAGFDLARTPRRPRPTPGGDGMSEHPHDHPHSHEHEHGEERHAHAHTEHDHEHVEHTHEHSHGDVTHSHPHVHQEGLEENHAHDH